MFKANTPLPSIWNLKVEAPAIEALILAIPVANVRLPEFGIILTVLAIYYKYSYYTIKKSIKYPP